MKTKNNSLTTTLEKLRRKAIKDCKKYHLALLKCEGSFEPKEQDLVDYLYNLSSDGEWEDVFYFVGYLRGLDDAQDLIDN